jgi:hypothetical protein
MTKCLRRLVILCAIGAAVVFSSGAYAAPLISFTPLAPSAPTTPINSFKPFNITIGQDGTGAIDLQNLIGQLIEDFHFTSSFQGSVLTGNGGGFFSLIENGTNTNLDFSQGGIGSGIANDAKFRISLSGFTAGAKITANATPEPSSLMLLVLGLSTIILLGLQADIARWRQCIRAKEHGEGMIPV